MKSIDDFNTRATLIINDNAFALSINRMTFDKVLNLK